MRSYKCENCGAELEKDGEYFSCQYCHTTYRDDSIEKAYNRLYANLTSTVKDIVTEELMNARLEKIANCRQNLYRARTGVYIDSKEIGKWSDEILKLNPDDVQATFYSIAAKERWQDLNAFLATINAREVGYFVPDFVDYLTNGRFVEECMLRVTDLIARAFSDDSKEYEVCQKKIKRAADDERSGIFDERLPRDVFVAYSSKDKERAYELVEYLEANGFSCFIAMRNLAKGVNAEMLYNDRLKAAIDNCRVFALVSSKNSRARNCDAFNIEMRYVRDCDIRKSKDQNAAAAHYELYLENHRSACKPRVEYLIEDYANGIYEQEVKKFFGGLTWQKTKEGVCKAVYDYVENMPVEEDVEAELKRKAAEMQAEIDRLRLEKEKEAQDSKRRAEEELKRKNAESERQKYELEQQRLEIERQRLEFEKQRAEEENRRKAQKNEESEHQKHELEQQRLEIERQRLELEKQRAEEENRRKTQKNEESERQKYELEQQRLEIERQKLEFEKQRAELEAKAKTQNSGATTASFGDNSEMQAALEYFRAQQAKIKAQEEAKRKAEEDAKRKAEEAARKKAEKEAKEEEERENKAKLLLDGGYIREGDKVLFGLYPQNKKSFFKGKGDGHYFGTQDGCMISPIEWRILKENDGKALLLSEKILCLGAVHEKNSEYSESPIRAWLNGTFYNVAFSQIGKNRIISTKLSNNSFYDNIFHPTAETEDKIFLLNYSDATNKTYGFDRANIPVELRKKMPTEYAWEKNFGRPMGKPDPHSWWLRTAAKPEKEIPCTWEVSSNGEVGTCKHYYRDYSTGFEKSFFHWGIVPALWIDLTPQEEILKKRKAAEEAAKRKAEDAAKRKAAEEAAKEERRAREQEKAEQKQREWAERKAREAKLKDFDLGFDIENGVLLEYFGNGGDVVLPDSVKTIGKSAFKGCKALKRVTIPNSVTSICEGAFLDCQDLTSVRIPCSVIKMEANAFKGCPKLTVYADWPKQPILWNGEWNSDNRPVEWDFKNREEKRLTQEKKRKEEEEAKRKAEEKAAGFEIENSVLKRYTGKGGDIVIPKSVSSIGDRAFAQCNSLTSVTLPDSVTSIGSYAFDRCSELKSINIPNSVKFIGEFAFNFCSNLTIYAEAESEPSGWRHATLGGIWNCSGRPVFWGCNEEEAKRKKKQEDAARRKAEEKAEKEAKRLAEEEANRKAEEEAKRKAEEAEKKRLAEEEKRKAEEEAKRKAEAEKRIIETVEFENLFKDYLEDDKKTSKAAELRKADEAMQRKAEQDVNDCEIEYGIQADGTLYGILKKYTGKAGTVVIPSSVTEIGKNAFAACKGLTKVTIPDSVTIIGEGAFSDCCNLKSVTTSKSLMTIGARAFASCISLTDITIPNSLTSIGNFAFYSCNNLQKLKLPKSVVQIGANAFNGCRRLWIYAEAEKKPDGWVQKMFGDKWNPDKCPVSWGSKIN